MPLPDSEALSCEVHTNRELELMLEKGKPLAHFSDAYPGEPNEEIFPEQAFARYVENGRFVKRDFVEPLREPPPKDHPHLRGPSKEFPLAAKVFEVRSVQLHNILLFGNIAAWRYIVTQTP